MKTKLFLPLFLILASVMRIEGQVPDWKWARNAIGTQYDQASAVTADLFGNTYVAGYFASDSILFGEIVLHNNGIGFDDIFIAKYDSNGNLIWARGIGGSGDDKAYSVTTDSTGNVYLAANYYSPTIEVDTFRFTNAGNVGDILLVKFDTDGNILMAKREGGPGLEIPYAIRIDGFDNIVVTGRFSSQSVTFGTFTLNQAGSMDVFIVKYNPDGNVLWAKSAGGTSNDESLAIDVDVSGNIFVAGYYNGNAKFETVTLSTSGQADAFLVKYDPDGNLIWAKNVGGDNADRITGLVVDESGNSFVSGYFQSSFVEFGNTTLNNYFTEGIENSFIAKFDDDGNAVWAKSVNGKSKLTGIAKTSESIYACGVFTDDSLNFGSSVLYVEGQSDFFILNSDLDGNLIWAVHQNSGGESSEFATSIAADNIGNISVAGYFNSEPILFGPIELNSTGNRFDMFVARFGATTTTIAEVFIDENYISIFPNPGNGNFTIQSKNKIERIELYTLMGERVYLQRKLLGPFQNELNISFLPSGIYLIKLQVENKQIVRKIIIED